MYKRIILKYKKRYIKLLKEIFEDIKKDKDLKYLYFDREQKKFVENILNKSSFTILFGLYFKTFRRLLFFAPLFLRLVAAAAVGGLGPIELPFQILFLGDLALPELLLTELPLL